MASIKGIPEIFSKYNSVERVEQTSSYGKSGQELVYKIILNTNPIEFAAEIIGDKDIDSLGIAILLPDQNEEPDCVYALRAVSDLFWYLYDNGVIYDLNINAPANFEDVVKKVIDSIKKQSIYIDYNFYFNGITPEWFKNQIQ